MRDRTDKIAEERSYKIVKSNELVQKARYDLNIVELKILAFLFSKIKPTDKTLEEYSFSVKEFCDICGIADRSGQNYERIRKTMKALRDKSFWMLEEDGTEILVGWIAKVKIRKGSGRILVRLDEDLQKYVLGLFGNYSSYELLSTLPMRSAYSFRIYELLKSYAFIGHHAFDIDDLKRTLAAEHFKNFKDFRRRVIETAVREINRYTDLEVSWEPENFGRKVTKVIFHIRQRDAWGRLEASMRAEDQLDGQMNIYDFLDE